jgi:hypothetical protein
MAKPRKKIGAMLKLIGTAILLLSFGTQNFFYEISSARTAELLGAMRDRQMIDKSALLQESMYFSAINSASTLKDISATELAAAKASIAALKIAQSASVGINAAKAIPPQEAAAVIKAMFSEAERVNDYKSLNAFFAYIDKNVSPHTMQLNVQYEKELAGRKVSRAIYLILYLVGATFLLLGLFFEWRGAEE